MSHIQRINSAGLAMLALAVFVSGWFIPTAQAQTPAGTQIQRDGKLPDGSAYRSLVMKKYGRSDRTASANRIAAASSPGNRVVRVGNEPRGFGKGFIWDRKDDEILLAVFINAADDLGVSIENVRRNDIVEVTSAAGISSFSKDKGNPFALSIVGLIAVGAKAGAGLAGAPRPFR